jgi:branched-chain amino acid transport system substrate-binding protein
MALPVATRGEEAMKSLQYMRLLLVVCALLLAACGATSGGGVRDGTPSAPVAQAPATTAAGDGPTTPAADSSGAGEPYRLGVVLSITGPAASLGVPMRDTLLILQEQANSAGGIKGPDGAMHPVELTIIDDKSVETETVLAIKKLIEQQVLAIIGPNQTGTTLAVIPLVTEAQVPLVSLGSSSKIVEPIAERKWIFKTPHNDRLVIEVLMQDLKRRNITDVAFLSVNSALGDTGREAFAAAAQSQGINVVVEDRYGAEDTDMSSQVSKVKTAGAQALINWSVSPPDAARQRHNWL